MTVRQTGKERNTITIRVSDLDEEYKRSTMIMIPAAIHESGEPKFCTLENASDNGYIMSYYVPDENTNNGPITIEIPEEYIDSYPMWRVKVKAIDDNDITVAEVGINALLLFEYDGKQKKESGEEIDITVGDIEKINRIARYIRYWMPFKSTEVTFNYALNASRGDPIYADYLLTPANYIYDKTHEMATDPNLCDINDWYVDVLACALRVLKYCSSGGEFKALCFNNIRDAINLIYDCNSISI